MIEITQLKIDLGGENYQNTQTFFLIAIRPKFYSETPQFGLVLEDNILYI